VKEKDEERAWMGAVARERRMGGRGERRETGVLVLK
jgi:hypothetical protein